MADQRRALRLTEDEILVLFDLTHRWEKDAIVTSPIDWGEQHALDALTAALEPLVDAAFSPDFARLVAEAKARLSA